MSEPITQNIGLIVPNTGDLVGAWGTAAMNPNFQELDGILAGVTNLSFSAATSITLSVPAGASYTPGAGPVQSQNAMLNLNGTIFGNIQIGFTMPGKYIVNNKTVPSGGNFGVQLSPSTGTGNAIGAPPGECVTVFYDGTNVNYVDLGRVGERLDLIGWTTYPAWIGLCTVKPYLIRDGSVYSTSVYPILAQMLGSTFGGNGINTFGVPDSRARVDVPYDTGGTGRLTSGVSGVNGATMGSAGGNQAMQQHNHGVNDPTHSHGVTGSGIQNPVGIAITWGGGSGPNTVPSPVAANSIAAAATGISIQVAGAGASQNVQPSIVSHLPLIRAG